ncbi:MAG: pantoate--beta-alanine ligase [Bacteroidales bacterium]|jgi:pantoate--beta-alanine ligase|nr:pantoate--beta-alanine ligase [Bacteroidales bacterium]
MKIFKSISAIEAALQNVEKSGFVPTMGALHEGHLSLIRKAKSENGICVVSIFVNPIQFNNQEDLVKYPRTLDKDVQLLETILDENDIVFAPSVEEMYPERLQEQYDFGSLESVMEGKFRPGHFNGVAIVVRRLFEIVKPARAYFGEKDYQQLQIINKIVLIEKMPIEIIPCPIVREEDGLAMSSRNVRLTPENRKNASLIYHYLQTFVKEFDFSETLNNVIERINSIPNARVEYVELVDSETLQPVENYEKGKNYRLCAAVYMGDVRLIDNIAVAKK